MMPKNVRIGTSGFGYRDWLGNFYPQFCPQADFLRFYATQFDLVELDVTFYRIPSDSMVERWVSVTPDRFTFAAKFPRTVTHEGEVAQRVDNAGHFVSAIRGLGGKLGPLLLQFPYSFTPENWPILESIVKSLPTDLRLVVEVRNRKWLNDDLYEFLGSRNIALCLVDHPWMPRISVRTADFHYIRFLGDHKKITEDFSYVRNEKIEELSWWRDLINLHAGDMAELYALFNNHFSGHAPTTANQLRQMLTTNP